MQTQFETECGTTTKLRILVIEDDPEMRPFMLHLLQRNGFDAEATQNGHEGLRTAQTQDFDLILSDIELPGVNGFEICRQLNADPENKRYAYYPYVWASRSRRLRSSVQIGRSRLHRQAVLGSRPSS